jgi:hypothetical protein
MNENIESSINHLSLDISDLVPLPGNPRKGNVEAIAASYKEFGQVKPIVVSPNGDGLFTVIAGNHQVEAAKSLGWEKIAAVQFSGDDNRAVAFALADNRTTELGFTDPELLNDLLSDVVPEYENLWDDLGWDEFELAALDEQSSRLSALADDGPGYVAPVIINPNIDNFNAPTSNSLSPAVANSDGEARLVPSGEVDQKEVVVSGSTAIGQSGSTKAVVQYTLVFDEPDQQKKWYSFIRWLRTDPGYDGSTTAERLMNFIDAHSNF